MRSWSGIPVFGVAAYLLIRPFGIDDYFFHSRSGEYLLNTGHVLARNFFSFTAPEFPWINHSWLSGLLFALLTRAGGLEAVRIANAACFLAGGWLLQGALAGRVWAEATRFLFLLAYAMLGLQYEAVRPWTFSHPLFVAELALLWPAFEDGARVTARRWTAGLVLLWLWANLHGSFPVGLWLYALALVAARPRGWSAWLAGAVVAPFATPNGVEAWLIPLRFAFVYGWKGSGSPILLIDEWQSPWPPRTILLGLRLAAIAGVVTLLLGMRPWKFRTRADLLRTLFAISLLALALQAQRHLFYLVTGVGVLFAGELAREGAALGLKFRTEGRERGATAAGWSLGALAVCLPAALAAAPLLPMLSERYWPAGLIRHVAENRARYTNEERRTYWDFPLANIAIARPELGQRVFYDGREYGYPPEVTQDFYRLDYGTPGERHETARRWRLGYLVLSRGQDLEPRLLRDEREGVGYRTLYEDRWSRVVELLPAPEAASKAE